MNENNRKIISENITELVNITIRIDDIVQKLHDCEILNKHMVDYLQDYPNVKHRCREFYQMIQGRGPLAFDYLLTVLRETENNRAGQLLSRDKFMQAIEPDLPPPVVPDEEFDAINNYEQRIVVRVHPERKYLDVENKNLPNGVYRMRSNPRGLALIININQYHGSIHPERDGSELDFRSLKTLFKKLGYKIYDHQNLTGDEIKEVLTNFSLDPDLSIVDSVIVFIMAHGDGGGDNNVNIIGADGKKLNSNNIISYVIGGNNSRISDLPKMFFFQACRPDSFYAQTLPQSSTSNTDVENYKNIFVCYSTLPGYYAMRDTKTGAWLVNAFVKIVARDAWRYDFHKLMNMVDMEVGEKKSQFGSQVLQRVYMSFNKTLYFNPGLK